MYKGVGCHIKVVSELRSGIWKGVSRPAKVLCLRIIQLFSDDDKKSSRCPNRCLTPDFEVQGVGLRGVLARLFSFGRQEGAFVVTVSYLALFLVWPCTLALIVELLTLFGVP